MSTETMDTDELARLALGGRALKNRRVRRAIIARLINENGASHEGDESEEGDEEETTGSEGEVVRLLIGSRLLRRRRVRKALLTHLLRTKSEMGSEEEGEGEGDEEEETGEGGEGRELVRALIASKFLRRRRVRRALLVHLLRTKAESMSEADEGEEDSGDEGGSGGEDRELVRALIASKMLRRRRVRRALLTHLLRERDEAVA